MNPDRERTSIDTPKGIVSAIVDWSGKDAPLLLVGHGAGGDMTGPLLEGFAQAISSLGVSCLRFNFPFAEAGRKSPDSSEVLLASWRAAFDEASKRAADVWAGGKSMGGRYASMAAAAGMGVSGLIFLGYPLHPPGKPERLRVDHLPEVKTPMLFIQGTSDAFARWELLNSAVSSLPMATLHPIEGADHSFHIRGLRRSDAEIGRMLATIAAGFIQTDR